MSAVERGPEPLKRRASPWTRRALLAFGLTSAVLLVGLALLGFRDAQDAALVRLQREADASLRVVTAEWVAQLRGDDWPLEGRAAAVEVVELRLYAAEPHAADSLPSSTAATSLDARLHLVASRAHAAAGDLDSATASALEALASDPAAGGEALLAWVHAHALTGAHEALGDGYAAVASEIPWGLGVEGISARLLALLAAAPHLSESAIQSELDAARNERLLLPPSQARADVSASGFLFRQDPIRQALVEVAEARAALGQKFHSLLGVEAAEELAIAEAVRAKVGAQPQRGWSLIDLTESAYLLAREDEEGGRRMLRAAVIEASQLDAALSRWLPGDSALRVRAFSRDAGGETLTAGVPLARCSAAASIFHPRPADMLDDELWRVTAARAGLLALALLMAVGTFAAARTLEQSERLQALRSTFVASVSHDLRTPLASIGLLAENMAAGYARGNEDRYVDTIQRETARLRRLVDDLLDFGRIERGLPPRLQRATVDVATWLADIEERERGRCHAHDCSLHVERESLPPAAFLDAPAIERALSNLVDNALKHGQARAITVRARGEGETLVLEVLDDGSGLAGSSMKLDLFEPFQRHGETAGTGLGLSIVRAIAEAHGGGAQLEPAPSGGTIARMTLRITAATPPGAAA